MVPHWWPAAPDVIWHIYSHLYCSSRDLGRDLLSSREEALTMGKVPCEFWADRPGFSFSGKKLRKGSFQHCPSQDGVSSMASGSGCDLAHWLGTCAAPWGMVVGTCHLQGRQPLPWGRSPVSFEQIGQTSFFSRWLLAWFGTFTLGSAASMGF